MQYVEDSPFLFFIQLFKSIIKSAPTTAIEPNVENRKDEIKTTIKTTTTGTMAKIFNCFCVKNRVTTPARAPAPKATSKEVPICSFKKVSRKEFISGVILP